MNIKKLKVIVAAAVLSAAMFVPGVTGSCYVDAKEGVNVDIDGTFANYAGDAGTPFIDSSGRVQVPLRQTAESYGCTVKWDGSTKTAYITKDGKNVTVPVGQNYIVCDGTQKSIDTSAMILSGRIYMPIRAVLEQFGAVVHWNGKDQTVIIDSPFAKLINIYFEDVGQGDCTFIDDGDYEVLIDSGTSAHGEEVVNAIKPYVDGSLDLVIASHMDADHIGGMADVFSAFQVREVIENGDNAGSATYNTFKESVKDEAGCTDVADDNVTLDLKNGAQLKIIETGDNNGSENANSVVALFTYKNVNLLLAGDMTSDVEKANLSSFGDVDVFKASHHGSATSNSAEFLSVIRPEYVVVSAGTGNTYGHPTSDALERFFNIGADVFGTFKSSTIKMTTDGAGYYFDKNERLTLDDAGAGGTKTAAIDVPATASASYSSYSQSGSYFCDKNEAAYIGNSSTKKYHTLSCSYAAKISDKNLVYFSDESSAQSAGFSPCKVCKP